MPSPMHGSRYMLLEQPVMLRGHEVIVVLAARQEFVSSLCCSENSHMPSLRLSGFVERSPSPVVNGSVGEQHHK